MSEPLGISDCRRSLTVLVALACALQLIFVAVVFSSQSLHETGTGSHSLLTLLALFGFAFVVYLFAVRIAAKARQDGLLLWTIVGAAVLFRLTLLFSDPIEEIDMYRYLWDGSVIAQGVSPFRYSPQQVLAASAHEELPDDLARLVNLRDSSPEMLSILRKIHFGELPTIYPPVGQAVFALCAWSTPTDASLFLRLALMRAWFVAFDLGTLGLVITLLRMTGRPIGLSVIYGWCPLVLKEIANSGHLDSLAYFLTTASMFLAAGALFESRPGVLAQSRWRVAGSSALLALACGAKLYPIVLLPLLASTTQRRIGWVGAFGVCAIFAIVVAPLAWPMLPVADQDREVVPFEFDVAQVVPPSDDSPPVPPQDAGTAPHDPSQSLRAFLSEWEMNDFLFLIVMENLRPTTDLPPAKVAWFSVVPETWRSRLIDVITSPLAVDASRAPFFLTRLITSVVFIVIAGCLAWRARSLSEGTPWLETAFLTVASFWLLLPTLNPWYWTWVVPLVTFARGRAWLLMSGLVFTYYFRFWLMHHFPDTQVLGTHFNGPLFFDYVVVWLEFFPWFVMLAAGFLLRRPANRKTTAQLL